jgi:hypothetical protein
MGRFGLEDRSDHRDQRTAHAPRPTTTTDPFAPVACEPVSPTEGDVLLGTVDLGLELGDATAQATDCELSVTGSGDRLLGFGDQRPVRLLGHVGARLIRSLAIQ